MPAKSATCNLGTQEPGSLDGSAAEGGSTGGGSLGGGPPARHASSSDTSLMLFLSPDCFEYLAGYSRRGNSQDIQQW